MNSKHLKHAFNLGNRWAIGCSFSLFLLIAAAIPSFAQTRSLTDEIPHNRWSLELKVGAGLPIENLFTKKDSPSSYTYSFPGFNGGIRYMFTSTLGISASYTYNKFKNKAENFELTTNQITGELVYSFSNLFAERSYADPRQWNVLAHAGGAYTLGKIYEQNSPDPTQDIMVSAVIGATVQFRPRSLRNIAFVGDLSGYFNSFQNKAFDGNSVPYNSSELLDRLLEPRFYFYPSIGVQIFLGPHYQHSDWR
jgi:hypothetical protein